MGGFVDLTGKRFTRLKVIRRVGTGSNGSVIWRCRCDCGNLHDARMDSLRNGAIRSCGCLDLEVKTKHGLRYHPLYQSWSSMKLRCDSENCKAYKYYGGRGIKYDRKWKKFIRFKEDMYFKYLYAKRKYKDSEYPLSIERKDVNGNYCFDNCCFIPKNEQAKNTRRCRCNQV